MKKFRRREFIGKRIYIKKEEDDILSLPEKLICIIGVFLLIGAVLFLIRSPAKYALISITLFILSIPVFAYPIWSYTDRKKKNAAILKIGRLGISLISQIRSWHLPWNEVKICIKHGQSVIGSTQPVDKNENEVDYKIVSAILENAPIPGKNIAIGILGVLKEISSDSKSLSRMRVNREYVTFGIDKNGKVCGLSPYTFPKMKQIIFLATLGKEKYTKKSSLKNAK